MLSILADNIIDRLPPRILGALPKRFPRSFFDWKKKADFQYIIRYAYRHSPFYRKKFDSLKINPDKIKLPSDLGDFYTVPEDIINHAEEFLCRSPHIVFESSGTTGRNKRVYFTQDEIDDIGRFNAAGLFMGGVTRKDRFVNAFDFCIWIPGMITQKGIEKGAFLGMAAGKIDPMEVYKRIPVYNFNIILGEPTWIIKLTELAERFGSYPIKFIVGGGEAMPDAARPWIERVWQGAKVRMVYASVESGGIIAFEPFSECGGYHINENNFFVEIVDQDKDGYGEIVFTTLSRTTMPLVRYRNRDISRMMDQKCPCGLPYRRLEKMRGRADEMVVASGGNLYPLIFENILKEVDEVTTDWQVILKLRGIREVMEFNLELKTAGAEGIVKEKIFEGMKSKYPDLWKNLSLGIFETEFIFHPPATIRGGRKIIRLLDKRYPK